MYALHGVPREILQRAKEAARERGRSLDQEIVRFITDYPSSDSEAAVTACGAQRPTWSADAPPQAG